MNLFEYKFNMTLGSSAQLSLDTYNKYMYMYFYNLLDPLQQTTYKKILFLSLNQFYTWITSNISKEISTEMLPTVCYSHVH